MLYEEVNCLFMSSGATSVSHTPSCSAPPLSVSLGRSVGLPYGLRARPSTAQICLLFQNLFGYYRIPLNRIWLKICLKILSILQSFFNVLGLFHTSWVKLVHNWSIFVKTCKFWPIFTCNCSSLAQNPFGNPFENPLGFLLEILFWSKFCLFNRQSR